MSRHISPLLASRLRPLRRRAGARRGTVALELALIVPAMTIMMFGTYELTELVRVFMGLGLSSQVVADQISRYSPDTAPEITDACNGGKLVMMPFNGTTLKAAIASVSNVAGTATLNWHDETCGGATAISGPAAAAASLVPYAGDSVIMVQTTYTYTAATSYVLPQTFTLTHTSFAVPRPKPTGS
jgi:Flp pilus assembly protein TadG